MFIKLKQEFVMPLYSYQMSTWKPYENKGFSFSIKPNLKLITGIKDYLTDSSLFMKS